MHSDEYLLIHLYNKISIMHPIQDPLLEDKPSACYDVMSLLFSYFLEIFICFIH